MKTRCGISFGWTTPGYWHCSWYTYTTYDLLNCTAANSYCSTAYPRVKSRVRVSAKRSDNSVIRYDDYFLDRLDRQVQSERQVLGGGLSRIRTMYDDLGRVAQQSAPDFASIPSFYATTAYDLVSRPVSVSRPIDQSTPGPQYTLFSYLGLKTVVTDAENKTSTKYSDVKGRVVRSQDHNGYYQNFVFDAFGSLKEVKDSNNNLLFSAQYVYGVGPMRTQSFDMDMGTWTYAPNALGENESFTDANNKTFTATFDKLSRPKTRVDPANAFTSSTTTTWTWGTSSANNNVGKIVSIIQTGGHQESFLYDSLGRLSQRSSMADGTHLTNYSYNSTSGLLETYTFPTSTSGVRVKLKYDYSYGFTNKISDFSSPSTVFWQATAVDAGGRVIDEQLENGLQSVRAYDAVTGLAEYIQTGPSGSKQDNDFLWNKVGNLTSRSDTNTSRTLVEAFTYDNLHRLDYSTLDSGAGPIQNLNVDYDSTGLGNITKKTDVCSSNWTYDSAKKHAVISACGTAFQYDANGNQTKRGADDVEWYSYNYPSKIENGSRYHQFFYDGSRSRWKQIYNNGTSSETTLYVGSNFEKRTEGSYSQFRHYIRADGRLVAIVSRDTNDINNNLSVLTDHLGSVVRILGHSGSPDVSENFAAYGERRDPANWSVGIGNEPSIAALTQKGFQERTHLDASSLIHLGGRVLHAKFGRFLSADPTVPHPDSTQSFNRYSFVQNNPLSRVDPSGFTDFAVGGWDDGGFSFSFSYGRGSRGTYKPPPTGCITANARGCYGTAGVKTVIDAIFDKVIGPLPNHQRAEELVLYFVEPDCPPVAQCGSDDGDELDDVSQSESQLIVVIADRWERPPNRRTKQKGLGPDCPDTSGNRQQLAALHRFLSLDE
jgi:RHS repeat-associated protein